ncbi:MAG: hypothetical protein QXI49_05350 [Candidatus Methanomethylicaceae archaeon]
MGEIDKKMGRWIDIPIIPTFEKIVEYTITNTGINSITFTNLDLKTDKVYLVFFLLKRPGVLTDKVWMFYNNDTTQTNYYSQCIAASGTSVGAERRNEALLCWYGPWPVLVIIYITLMFNKIQSLIQYTRNVGSDDNAIYMYSHIYVPNAENLTSLTFQCPTATYFDVGSRIIIYRSKM